LDFSNLGLFKKLPEFSKNFQNLSIRQYFHDLKFCYRFFYFSSKSPILTISKNAHLGIFWFLKVKK